MSPVRAHEKAVLCSKRTKGASAKNGRKDLRLKAHQTGRHRVVAVMRQRGGRTLPFVFKHESDSIQTIRERVETGTIVFADEASSWDVLHARYDTRRIKHSVAFMKEGVCTNQAESYFSRFRRTGIGQHHKISGAYFCAYAARWLGERITAATMTVSCSF